MALVNSFEIIDLLSKNALGLVIGGKSDFYETTLTSKISIDCDSEETEKLGTYETSLSA
jgi:hypothetical protein